MGPHKHGHYSKTLKYLIENTPNFILIDIREPSLHESSHIEHSVVIEPRKIINKLSNLVSSKKTKLIIYDQDNSESPSVANLLIADGYHNVSILEGGLQQWILEQQPVKSLN